MICSSSSSFLPLTPAFLSSSSTSSSFTALRLHVQKSKHLSKFSFLSSTTCPAALCPAPLTYPAFFDSINSLNSLMHPINHLHSSFNNSSHPNLNHHPFHHHHHYHNHHAISCLSQLSSYRHRTKLAMTIENASSTPQEMIISMFQRWIQLKAEAQASSPPREDDDNDYDDYDPFESQQQQQQQQKPKGDAEVVLSEATTIVDVLADFWANVCEFLETDKSKVESRYIIFPFIEDLKQYAPMPILLNYLQQCADASDAIQDQNIVFSVLHPEPPVKGEDKEKSEFYGPITALVLKRPTIISGGVWSPYGDLEDDDPDNWDIDFSILDKYKDKDAEKEEKEEMRVVPENDQDLIDQSFEWVQALIVNLGCCPYTSSSAARAGLPMGNVRYVVTRADSAERLYRDYWFEGRNMMGNTQQDISTVLLIAPNYVHSVEAYDSICNLLTMCMESLKVEDYLQLVPFHPKFCFRDGAARVANDDQAAANYARRSPWPMFNLLRTNQVRAAQKVIPTGLVYAQNEKTLKEMGVKRLDAMLRNLDWKEIAENKPIDRRSNPLFEAAEKLKAEYEKKK